MRRVGLCPTAYRIPRDLFAMPTRRTGSPPSMCRGVQNRSASFLVRRTCPCQATGYVWLYEGVLCPNWAERKLRGPFPCTCPCQATGHVWLYGGVLNLITADWKSALHVSRGAESERELSSSLHLPMSGNWSCLALRRRSLPHHGGLQARPPTSQSPRSWRVGLCPTVSEFQCEIFAMPTRRTTSPLSMCREP